MHRRAPSKAKEASFYADDSPLHHPVNGGGFQANQLAEVDPFSEKTPVPSTNPYQKSATSILSDDELHNSDPRKDSQVGLRTGSRFTARGWLNFRRLAGLAVGIIVVLTLSLLLSHFLKAKPSTSDAYNLGATNASGQAPEKSTQVALIDKDTPQEAYTHTSIEDSSEWDLVFSDEFNKDGRSFYPGDDPHWEAVDLHYRQTGNLEWYSPDMVTTSGGSLNITLAKQPWKGMNYKGGLLSSWNKFCFTGGYFVANVSLPGTSKHYGLWPAIWTMGNLGRAGYGASLDGTWPYSYNTCDVGTLPNQTFNGKPVGATLHGDPSHDGALSYQVGQRLSACTCPGESHPGPAKSDGSFVGRAAPEIDIFEALVDPSTLIGHVSQSGQWAPFNYAYEWLNTTDSYKLYSNRSEINPYAGNVYQQSTSVVSTTNQDCYTQGSGCFTLYGFEYKPGNDGYITWVNDASPAWQIRGSAMGADARAEIGPRPISQEPMYMILNLGISPNFGAIDWGHLVFPTSMLVDWVRVYQPKGSHNVGCDPPDYPTKEYIDKYMEAYTNPNLTTWVGDYKHVIPKNRLVDSCT